MQRIKKFQTKKRFINIYILYSWSWETTSIVSNGCWILEGKKYKKTRIQFGALCRPIHHHDAHTLHIPPCRRFIYAHTWRRCEKLYFPQSPVPSPDSPSDVCDKHRANSAASAWWRMYIYTYNPNSGSHKSQSHTQTHFALAGGVSRTTTHSRSSHTFISACWLCTWFHTIAPPRRRTGRRQTRTSTPQHI